MKHSGIELEAMAAIAKAAKVRSLEDFQAAVSAVQCMIVTIEVPFVCLPFTIVCGLYGPILTFARCEKLYVESVVIISHPLFPSQRNCLNPHFLGGQVRGVSEA